jgi:hypothetical protein
MPVTNDIMEEREMSEDKNIQTKISKQISAGKR